VDILLFVSKEKESIIMINKLFFKDFIIESEYTGGEGLRLNDEKEIVFSR